MDLPRLYAMDRYWQTHPPLREMVQSVFFGRIEQRDPLHRTTSSAEPHSNTEQDLDDFVKMFSEAGGKVT